MANGCNVKNIRLRLLQEMKEGIFLNRNKLPRETELSEMLGISRTQLRDVLSELEREGFITRRHGVGTLINRSVLQVTNRMDIETEFLEMIRQSGYVPGTIYVGMQEETADETIASRLEIPLGTEVVRFSRLCTADGKPVIYCEDVLEKRLITDDYTQQDLEQPIFHFLQQFCGLSSYMDLTELHAVAADEKLSAVLQVPVGTPLLNMEEVDFDIEGKRIFCSSEYFVDGLLPQTVLRKKL